MDKFIYAVADGGDVQVKTIMGNSINDAKQRIIRKYFDRYEDLESDEWEDFLDELYDAHDIAISEDLIEENEI